MRNNHLAVALLGATVLTAPALAQTANQSAPADRQVSAQAGNVQFMNQAQPGQWRAGRLAGVDIYGPNNEKIGDVNDVLLDSKGHAQAVVIGVGGFLGIGEKDVAVPFDAVRWSNQPRSAGDGANRTNTTGSGAAANDANRDYPDHGILNLSKEQLQNAPAFRYASDRNSNTAR